MCLPAPLIALRRQGAADSHSVLRRPRGRLAREGLHCIELAFFVSIGARMSELVAAFVSELIRSANETERLSNYERSRLLRRAARTINEYREMAGGKRSEGGIAYDLNAMADAINLHSPKEVAAAMLNAVAAINAGRSDREHALNIEYEDLIKELNNPDGTT